MSEIRARRVEGETQYAPLTCDAHVVLRCVFCNVEVASGTFWMGATGDLCVCRLCVLDSRLGMLIGDALDTVADIAKALLATERHVYRSRLMAFERRDRAALEVERYTIDRGPLDP